MRTRPVAASVPPATIKRRSRTRAMRTGTESEYNTPPTAKAAIKRPAIDARVSPIARRRSATYGNSPWMKIASKNTDMKHTLARGSAKMLRKLAMTAARLKGAGGGVTTPRNATNAATVATENSEYPPPAQEVADHAGDRCADEI